MKTMKTMKTRQTLLALVVVMGVMLASTSVALATDTDFGSTGASLDDSYTLEEMLVYAIQDEYMAQAEYDAIMDSYGVSRPFSNIIRSEGMHINLLLPLFQSLGYEVPLNNAADLTILPASLEEAYAIGVEAEIKNIAMYESFLKEDLPEDVKAVFERLMNASESHLRAFENAVDGIGNGSGNRNAVSGNGFGRGMQQNGARGFGNGNTGTCIVK